MGAIYRQRFTLKRLVKEMYSGIQVNPGNDCYIVIFAISVMMYIGVVIVPTKPMTWAAMAGRNAALAGPSAVATNAGNVGRTHTPVAPVINSVGRTPDGNQPSKTAAASYATAYFCFV